MATGDHLSKDKLFDIQEKTKKKESPGRILFAADTARSARYYRRRDK